MCLYVYVPFAIFSYFFTVRSIITTALNTNDTYMMMMMIIIMMMMIIVTIIVNRVRSSKTCFVRRV